MQRLITRILLLTALLGTFVPVALAIGAPDPPHACCLRKLRNSYKGTSFEAVPPGNCCPPRTPNLWAAPVAGANVGYVAFVTPSAPPSQSQQPPMASRPGKSVRAPPSASLG